MSPRRPPNSETPSQRVGGRSTGAHRRRAEVALRRGQRDVHDRSGRERPSAAAMAITPRTRQRRSWVRSWVGFTSMSFLRRRVGVGRVRPRRPAGARSASRVAAPTTVLRRRAARSARRSATAGTMARSASATAHMKVWPKAVATGPLICSRSLADSGASSPPAPPPADGRAAVLSCWRTTASSAVPIERAELPQRVERGGGARHLRRVEQRVGRGGRGLDRRAEAEAAHEEHAAEQRVRRVVAHEHERHRRQGEDGDARDHHRPAADAVGQTTADRQHQRGPDALRGKQQAGVAARSRRGRPGSRAGAPAASRTARRRGGR